MFHISNTSSGCPKKNHNHMNPIALLKLSSTPLPAALRRHESVHHPAGSFHPDFRPRSSRIPVVTSRTAAAIRAEVHPSSTLSPTTDLFTQPPDPSILAASGPNVRPRGSSPLPPRLLAATTPLAYAPMLDSATFALASHCAISR